MGKFLGIWLSFRVAGQIVGGAINLGMNADGNYAGAINPKVYIVFIALTSLVRIYVCGSADSAGTFRAYLSV